MKALLHVLFLVGLPGLTLLAARRFRPVAWVGPVVLCYLGGIALGNVPGLGLDPKVSMTVSEAAVPLAIPLLLFSTDVRRWLRLAKTTLVSFGLACVASIASAVLVGRGFSERSDEWWKMAGMLVGVYTGGTANMNAVGLALEVREETFVLLNTADMIVSAAYLLFLLTVAQRVALRFLPPFPQQAQGKEDVSALLEEGGPEGRVRGMVLAFLLAVAIAGVSVGVTLAVAGKLEVAGVMLLLTTLALVASLFPAVRHLRGSFALGDYALLVFCVSVGSLADARRFLEAGPVVFAFCGGVMVVAILFHFVMAALFRLDADTVLITSTATIFGPPFIAPVARALGNRDVLVSGLTSGLMGYAVGTYLGLATAYLLRP
jgi:uncharacterized membrane protein